MTFALFHTTSHHVFSRVQYQNYYEIFIKKGGDTTSKPYPTLFFKKIKGGDFFAKRKPSLGMALLPVVVAAVTLYVGIVILEADAHIPLIVSLL